MKRPNENPLPPASLATGGVQGAEAKAQGQSGAEDSLPGMGSHYIVCVAVDAARVHLAAISYYADVANPWLDEAAKLLDSVAKCLRQAGIEDLEDWPLSESREH